MISLNKAKHSRFPCKACGLCCQKGFINIPTVAPEAAEEVASLDRGDGQCKNFDFETNKCSVYENRPWFCNGYTIWEKYYEPQGLPLDFAYSVMKHQCKVFAGEVSTLDEKPKAEIPEKYLPLGTVVILQDGLKDLMIYGRHQIHVETNDVYDYVACLHPEGNMDAEFTYFFNHEQIRDVLFMGYVNHDEKDYVEYLLEESQA